MVCKNCGNQMKEGSKFCPVCGTPAASNRQAPAVQNSYQGYNQYNTGNVQPTGSNAGAVVSLVLGIVGLLTGALFGLGCILGIIGIVMSSKAKKSFGPSGMATAGLVLSILAVVFGAFWLACTVCGVGLGGMTAFL